MAYCKNCGKEISSNDVRCPDCGTIQNNIPVSYDNGGFGWGLLGCCIPVVGLILYLVWKDTKPNTAKAAGIGALVSAIISVLYYIFVIAAGVGAGMMY